MTVTDALPRLYFNHLPKTGGTSLRYVLRHAYGARMTYPAGRLPLLAQSTLPALMRYRCFGGHFGRSFPALFPPDHTFIMVTLLRDPLKRSISQLNYTGQLLENRPHLVDAAARRGWEAWQRVINGTGSAAGDKWLDNRQTRLLGGDFDLRPYFTAEAARSAATIQDDYETTVAAVDPNDAYARAMQTLRQCAVVGVTERFAETATLMCDLIGVRPPPFWPELNRTKPRDAKATAPARGGARLSPAVQEQLESILTVDRELYALANAMLDEQMAAYHARPQRSFHWLPSTRLLAHTAARTVLTQVEANMRRLVKQPSARRRLGSLWRSLTRWV